LSELRHPPADTGAEQSVLGAILLRNETISFIDLEASEFYDARNAVIYGAMRELAAGKRPIDPVTLEDRLGPRVDALGGLAILSDLISSVPTADNIEFYAEIVRRRAQQRKLILAASSIVTQGMDEPGDDFVENASKLLLDATQGIDRTGPLGIKPLLRSTFDALCKRMDGATSGVKTGFDDLDAVLGGGFQSSDLIILAARPSMGKTALAICTAINAAVAGHACLVFSMEMSGQQLCERMFSSEAKVNMNDLRAGIGNVTDVAHMSTAFDRLNALPLEIMDSPGLTLQELMVHSRRWAVRTKPGLIIVDYLQLLRVRGMNRNSNREQEVSEISRGLKQIARDVRCPVLTLAQLNRSCEHRDDKRPIMSDLRDSGGIEQDADVIAFLYRDEVYNKSAAKGETELIIRKQRNGEAPVTVKLGFNARYTKFENLSKKDWGF